MAAQRPDRPLDDVAVPAERRRVRLMVRPSVLEGHEVVDVEGDACVVGAAGAAQHAGKVTAVALQPVGAVPGVSVAPPAVPAELLRQIAEERAAAAAANLLAMRGLAVSGRVVRADEPVPSATAMATARTRSLQRGAQGAPSSVWAATVPLYFRRWQ
jgi:hypothetical protein